MVAIELKPEHGWVAAVAIGSYIVHYLWMPAYVMSGRKKYGVKYPALYADSENCKNEEHRNAFNCIQRGHQNSLENQPGFLTLLAVAGIRFPLTAAIGGAAYLAGRCLYMLGYSTGKPDGRYRGGPVMYPGLLVLLGAGIRFAYELVAKKL
mmetsp:Transcript_31850/g.70759  ORF Transcript_31850/g.70759 Transcript_31850/m.70759 type:complete len:151 (+) Transcript_31850:170-622(+)|eukprot:CAMPEP_0202904798 /NCGR_PEP_ID=MMETSP1392-20130828/31148_1 /ASSEMBLY_ACC=CAM_ASM_000868 /TAXON_ID=225041 /ORGANISM="Chlamydomonas chlamydogama, Strain SAG 11-48b" /LENGTH=150 /DNA_ID=CAMNT_0049592611 /DNA_START=163 /DNA_END=615 /DNA_ORIENTATION=+